MNPTFTHSQLEAIADALADTAEGITARDNRNVKTIARNYEKTPALQWLCRKSELATGSYRDSSVHPLLDEAK